MLLTKAEQEVGERVCTGDATPVSLLGAGSRLRGLIISEVSGGSV